MANVKTTKAASVIPEMWREAIQHYDERKVTIRKTGEE